MDHPPCKLILIRHGAYTGDTDGELTETGKTQIERMAEKLTPYIGATRLLITSTARRAVQSADILKRHYGVEPIPEELFWSGQGHEENLDAALNRIKQLVGQYETVVIVTHLEYANWLPGRISQFYFQRQIRPLNVSRGEAVLIDFSEMTVRRIA